MKIGRIGHASIVVETNTVRCAMDPILFQPFDCGTAVFEPPVDVHAGRLREWTNLVILSHEHPDHFDVASLNAFDRETLVYYPAGASHIERALARLKFYNARPVRLGTSISLGDLEIIPTHSRVPFVEMGVLFRSNGYAAWNLVDSVVDEEIISFALGQAGTVDVALAGYQPLVQLDLTGDALGSGFPFARYGQLIRTVLDIGPRWVVPSACGIRYVDEWLNDRGFPMTPEQFIADVRRVAPAIQCDFLPPGSALTVGDVIECERDVLPFVERRGAYDVAHYDWRPDRGIAALADPSRAGLDSEELRQWVDTELTALLVEALRDPMNRGWRERMARLEAIWRLTVVYPDGTDETRFLDLGRGVWLDSGTRLFAKISTTVRASCARGLADGTCHPDSMMLGGMRTTNRLYEVSRGGAAPAGDATDEPLLRFIGQGALTRYWDRELARLGY